MNAKSHHVARSAERPPLRHVLRLWFSLLGGAFAWATHFGLNYTLVSLQCVTGWFGARVVGGSVLTWLILLLTLGALGVTIASGMTARSTRRAAIDAGAPEDAYTVALPWGGLLLSGLFVVLIVFETLPIFFLRPCG